MKRIMIKLTCLMFLLTFGNVFADQFGYIGYNTTNIGDDIQAVAAKQFLPKNAIGIDREFVADFTHSEPVRVLMNGWFMHHKNSDWFRKGINKPENSWPPSSIIEPLIISIHFNPKFYPLAFTKDGIDYLKKYAPIGARDYSTLAVLQEHKIDSYFSGCLTLTLDNKFHEREDVIYAVDLDKECLEYLRAHAHSPVHVISHESLLFLFLDQNQRLLHAEQLLEKYSKAKCVVTTRLHATMPCLALETPVLLIENHCLDERFDGLKELVHYCNRKDLLKGESGFDFDYPPSNPEDYLILRKNLIKKVKAWIKKK